MKFQKSERDILRELAKRVANIADTPVMDRRRKMWIEHNSLRSTYPMMLIFPEGSWAELHPEATFRCSEEEARKIEGVLHRRIYGDEHFQDDMVVEKEWIVEKCIRSSGWGLDPLRIPSTETHGAWHFDPVIKEPGDLKKLRFPEITYDAATTDRDLVEMQDLFGDILTVKCEGMKHISYHLLNQYTALRGLEEVMIDMYTEPGMLHDAMAFLEEGHRRILRQYVEQNLLSFNNDNSYQNSGGNGYTNELPRPGVDVSRVRPCDMWASAEAQEMALVSPEFHAKFVLEYEKRLLEPFGLTGYGCCDDMTKKLDYVFTIPHIRRISISPWSDVNVCAEKLKGDYIFSWKPNPAQLVGGFNTDTIRAYIRNTVTAARDNQCVLEIILKDTHTCEGHPERFDIWTRICREEISKSAG
jgi:hypothetical protein